MCSCVVGRNRKVEGVALTVKTRRETMSAVEESMRLNVLHHVSQLLKFKLWRNNFKWSMNSNLRHHFSSLLEILSYLPLCYFAILLEGLLSRVQRKLTIRSFVHFASSQCLHCVGEAPNVEIVFVCTFFLLFFFYILLDSHLHQFVGLVGSILSCILPCWTLIEFIAVYFGSTSHFLLSVVSGPVLEWVVCF